jgi:hypothetical protein
MLPSAVNDTMRDMMAQIRDVGDGIRGGTYTMTAPVITGGSITGVALSGNTLTNPVITGAAISTSTLTGNTFTSPVISGGSINNTTVGATTASTGAFTTLSATGNVSFDGGSFVFNEAGADKDARFEGDTDANLLFLDASTDRIGIGTSSPSQRLDVVTSSGFAATRFSNGTTTAICGVSNTNTGYLSTETNHPFAFVTNGSERMRISSDGDLLVGTTTVVSGTSTDRAGIVVKGTIGTRASMKVCANNDTATFALIIFANDTDGQIGSVTQNSNGTVNYNTSSDYRLKENIIPMTGALEKVSQLKPCVGNWKKNGSYFQGFIAHELQEVVPDAVAGEKDAVDAEGKPVYQGIDTSFLVATLTASIQELKAIVDAQAARIAALESK